MVGIFDSGGSAFDSEVWCDSALLDQIYNRPVNIYQSVTVRLNSPDGFQAFKDTLTSDPRLTVSVDREIDYYAKQSGSSRSHPDHRGRCCVCHGHRRDLGGAEHDVFRGF